MKKLISIFNFKMFLLVFALSAAPAFGQNESRQQQADPCYEVVLQMLVASNTAGGKANLPSSLANVVKKLKTNYSFTDYRLGTTFLQRTSDSIEYKSMLNDFTGGKDANAPVFSEWSLRNLRNLPTAGGRRAIQFERFSFGARVPVATGSFDSNGKNASAVNYESLGITTTRFSLSENEPTVIGSLATSKPDELMFLVLTVRSAE